MTDVAVTFERKFSDGEYGSMGLSMSWTVTYDDSALDLAAEPALVSARCDVIASALRDAVLTFLSRSGAQRVSYAAKRELEAPEREARIRESAEYELAAGLRDNARGDDDLEEAPF
jgi:hypothetical protein